MDTQCKHIIVNGRRQGQRCNKQSCFFMSQQIPYCFTHKYKYNNQKNRIFVPKPDMFSRGLCCGTVCRLGRTKESLELSKYHYAEQVKEQEDKEIIEVVDKILMNVVIAARRFDGRPYLNRFRIFNDEFDGFDKEQIINELILRGYKGYPEEDSIKVIWH